MKLNRSHSFGFLLASLLFLNLVSRGADNSSSTINANRLTYLDEFNPFWPTVNSPKLTTPQWVGEPDVEAVVILSIDDMAATEKYETMLKPILDRLKKIDGHAPLSIFCTAPKKDDPHLQTLLQEGVSLETHTLTHPCPCLQREDFNSAVKTFQDSVDLLSQVPGNKPTAFRMPCCDSINSLSPRFYAEILRGVTPGKNFVTIDSSVMNITTANDSSLPRTLTTDADGREKFRKYLSFPSFATTIENYPYPYQVGKIIWEFPAMVPSDWEGQNLNDTNSSATLADWKAGLDVAVLQQGVFTLVFHPHGWIRSEQIIAFIDYATSRYGKKIKFLNFHEAQARLDKNLLTGQPLRTTDGKKNGVLLMDVNNDGYMDVVMGNDTVRKTRVWNPSEKKWLETNFPTQIVNHVHGLLSDTDPRFGIVQTNGFASVILSNEQDRGAWDFDGHRWIENRLLLDGLQENDQPVYTRKNRVGAGVRLRDIDNDGRCELIVANDLQNAIFQWSPEKKTWEKLPFALPGGTTITDKSGQDLGLRFVDVNADGFADVIFSNENGYSLDLFVNKSKHGEARGWSKRILTGQRGANREIPPFVRSPHHGNNGAWFHHRTLYVQNEDTVLNHTNITFIRSFDQLLAPGTKK